MGGLGLKGRIREDKGGREKDNKNGSERMREKQVLVVLVLVVVVVVMRVSSGLVPAGGVVGAG